MTSAMTNTNTTKRTPVPMNGVDTPKLLATIQAVGAQPELAKFRFRANNRWVAGTHSESTMHGFFGAGAEHRHLAAYQGNRRSSGRAVRRRFRADAGRMAAARVGNLPDGRHWQHRGGARHQAQ